MPMSIAGPAISMSPIPIMESMPISIVGSSARLARLDLTACSFAEGSEDSAMVRGLASDEVASAAGDIPETRLAA